MSIQKLYFKSVMAILFIFMPNCKFKFACHCRTISSTTRKTVSEKGIRFGAYYPSTSATFPLQCFAK